MQKLAESDRAIIMMISRLLNGLSDLILWKKVARLELKFAFELECGLARGDAVSKHACVNIELLTCDANSLEGCIRGKH